jgi:hypothetical protein
MRVYLAGAYSADNVLGVLKNIGRGEYWAAKLFLWGYDPFCPFLDSNFAKILWDEKLEVERFRAYTMSWLEVSDCVLVMPSYEESKGTLAEIERAKELGIPLFYTLAELENYVDAELIKVNNSIVAEEILSEMEEKEVTKSGNIK